MTNNKAPPTDLKVVTKKSPVSARKISQQTWKRQGAQSAVIAYAKGKEEVDEWTAKLAMAQAALAALKPTKQIAIVPDA